MERLGLIGLIGDRKNDGAAQRADFVKRDILRHSQMGNRKGCPYKFPVISRKGEHTGLPSV